MENLKNWVKQNKVLVIVIILLIASGIFYYLKTKKDKKLLESNESDTKADLKSNTSNDSESIQSQPTNTTEQQQAVNKEVVNVVSASPMSTSGLVAKNVSNALKDKLTSRNAQASASSAQSNQSGFKANQDLYLTPEAIAYLRGNENHPIMISADPFGGQVISSINLKAQGVNTPVAKYVSDAPSNYLKIKLNTPVITRLGKVTTGYVPIKLVGRTGSISTNLFQSKPAF